MRTLDETDREILRLLLSDARRPYSEIADRVGLSAPAVSDRIDRLRDAGVIEGFTLRIDDRELSSGLETLVTLRPAPAEATRVYDALAGHDRVENAFLTADGDVVVSARIADGEVRDLIDEAIGMDSVAELSVQVIDRQSWSPAVGDVDLAVDCVECDNTVTTEGESARIDGTLYHFCCGSCLQRFEQRYDRLSEDA